MRIPFHCQKLNGEWLFDGTAEVTWKGNELTADDFRDLDGKEVELPGRSMFYLEIPLEETYRQMGRKVADDD